MVQPAAAAEALALQLQATELENILDARDKGRVSSPPGFEPFDQFPRSSQRLQCPIADADHSAA